MAEAINLVIVLSSNWERLGEDTVLATNGDVLAVVDGGAGTVLAVVVGGAGLLFAVVAARFNFCCDFSDFNIG